eukprot:CAMPEP_0170494582 /NCGR_PEP_ID=MMETSP0208-20121228/14723_1 /TAXON_ID=197538 /ORGANISM="Strombidium inclinatum, Strain S3" /LENGTH=50 /DNA_ID=CAMNT_0010770659 /DNA_START=1213 /DNA_END=1365 /DNA_ORIENTATION=+
MDEWTLMAMLQDYDDKKKKQQGQQQARKRNQDLLDTLESQKKELAERKRL